MLTKYKCIDADHPEKCNRDSAGCTFTEKDVREAVEGAYDLMRASFCLNDTKNVCDFQDEASLLCKPCIIIRKGFKKHFQAVLEVKKC